MPSAKAHVPETAVAERGGPKVANPGEQEAVLDPFDGRERHVPERRAVLREERGELCLPERDAVQVQPPETLRGGEEGLQVLEVDVRAPIAGPGQERASVGDADFQVVEARDARQDEFQESASRAVDAAARTGRGGGRAVYDGRGEGDDVFDVEEPERHGLEMRLNGRQAFGEWARVV